jgi:hypothetical protein
MQQKITMRLATGYANALQPMFLRYTKNEIIRSFESVIQCQSESSSIVLSSM